MSYLFDSSSIFEALLSRRLRLLSGNFTISLARYELGNIVWKRGTLEGGIRPDRWAKLLVLVRDGLKFMEVLGIEGQEEGVLEVAEELKISFYDASYVHAAKARGMPLVTEDRALRERAKDVVEILNVDQIGGI